MTKLGTPYQELVSLVARALSPEATTTVGDWLDGPDGEREVDVRVEGSRSGRRHFVLIECKDWTRPVGIKEVDALDSKRRDLEASEAIIFSNSGFTRDAVAKARRVGIGAASALVAEDKRVRIVLTQLFVATRRRVDRAVLKVYADSQEEAKVADGFDWRRIQLAGKPMVNWVHIESLRILQQVDRGGVVAGHYGFRNPTSFAFESHEVLLRGLSLILQCSVRFVCQNVRIDVTHGFFDHPMQRVVVPNNQGYVVGPFDPKGWEPYEGDYVVPELPPQSFHLGMVLFAPFEGDPTAGTPHIDELIVEQEIKGPINGSLEELGLA